MSSARLVAVSYDSAATAESALVTLEDLANDGALVLHDAAVVVRGRTGGGGNSVSIHQARHLAAGEGAVSGGTLGLLVGLVLGAPVVGAVVGLAGGVAAIAVDSGIPDDELRRVGEDLEPGRAALFALVSNPDLELLGHALAPYRGTIVASEVSDEVAAALSAAP